MRKLRSTLVLLGAAVIQACATSRAHNPMVAGSAPVAAIRTIAVSSTVLPWELPTDTVLRQQFDSAFIGALRLAGFRVVPPAKVDPIWRALTDTAQLYDPRTGILNAERYATVVRAMTHEVSVRFGADAWMVPDFTIRDARYSSGWCDWDGTKQYVHTNSDGVRNGFANKTLSPMMRALSVRVTVTDTMGREIYRNYAGVAALVKVAPDGIKDVHAGEALASFERNATAVRLVLRPLVSTFP